MKCVLLTASALLIGVVAPRRDLTSRVETLERELKAARLAIDALVEAAPAATREKVAKVLEATAEESRVTSTRVLLESLVQALELRKIDTNAYPDGGNAVMVASLREKYARFEPRQLDAQGRVTDAWGRPLVYRRTAGGFELYSTGKDGKDDGGKGDDLR